MQWEEVVHLRALWELGRSRRTEYVRDRRRGSRPSPVFSKRSVPLCLRTGVCVAIGNNSERLLEPGRTHIPQDLVHVDQPIPQLHFRAG